MFLQVVGVLQGHSLDVVVDLSVEHSDPANLGHVGHTHTAHLRNTSAEQLIDEDVSRARALQTLLLAFMAISPAHLVP